MRAVKVTTDALALSTWPFLENATVVATKPTATNASLEGSLDGSTGWTEIATIVATEYQTVELTYPYVRVASGNPVFLLGT